MKKVTTETCDACSHDHTKALVYVCNICRKEFHAEFHNDRPFFTDTVIHLSFSFGYSSNRDGEQHEVDLCEGCYDTHILPLMKINPVVSNFINGLIWQDEDGTVSVNVPRGHYLVNGEWIELDGFVVLDALTPADIQHELAEGETLVNLLNGDVTVRRAIA